MKTGKNGRKETHWLNGERRLNEGEGERKRFLMLIYECLTVVSWNKWVVGVVSALLPVQDTKCIVRSAIRPNLHM